MLSEFGRRWDEPRLSAARKLQLTLDDDALTKLFRENYGTASAERDKLLLLLRVPNYFEDLALMVKLGDLNMDNVELAVGSRTLQAWSYWKGAIAVICASDRSSYAEFRWLVKELEKRAESERRYWARRAVTHTPAV